MFSVHGRREPLARSTITLIGSFAPSSPHHMWKRKGLLKSSPDARRRCSRLALLSSEVSGGCTFPVLSLPTTPGVSGDRMKGRRHRTLDLHEGTHLPTLSHPLSSTEVYGCFWCFDTLSLLNMRSLAFISHLSFTLSFSCRLSQSLYP